MATRIIIVDSSGQPIFGCDSHHGDDHAAAWIEDSLALLAEQGITATREERDAVRAAAREGYVETMERRA